MPESPRILGKTSPADRPSARGLAPAGLPDVAGLLLLVGLVLALIGWIDVALLYYPSQFGQNEWEFGIIATTFDTLPMPTFAMLLLAMGLRARGGAAWLQRGFAVACAVVMVAVLLLWLLFLLDIPVAWQAMTRVPPGATGAAAQPNVLVMSGIKRGIAKAVVFGVAYAATFLGMAIMMWRGARR